MGKMPYSVRISLGITLGLTAILALWKLVGITWLTATAAALLAPLAFLGSYFIWSADRPEDGYEQVLFDRPNTLVSAGMIAAFALAGVGTGFLATGPPAPPSPDGALVALANDYQAISDDYVNARKNGEATFAALSELKPRAEAIGTELASLPESWGKTTLLQAHRDLAAAIETLSACADAGTVTCEAKFLAADALTTLQRYKDGPPPPEDGVESP